ncbi:MAG: DedA family protein [Spirochaetes bacterium]|nr:DedA family protein [Spirochaetota bacterium]
MESFILQYGYPVIFFGTFFEGETVLVIAGFAAHRGYLDLHLAIAAAFAGSLLGDQLYFFIGRYRGRALAERRPRLRKRLRRFNAMMDRYGTIIILGFRFVYGIRTISPFAIGMSSISAWRFLLLNTASAAVWAAAIGTAGYLFGNAVELLLGEVRRYELLVMALLLCAGITFVAVRRLRRRGGNEPETGGDTGAPSSIER